MSEWKPPTDAKPVSGWTPPKDAVVVDPKPQAPTPSTAPQGVVAEPTGVDGGPGGSMQASVPQPAPSQGAFTPQAVSESIDVQLGSSVRPKGLLTPEQRMSYAKELQDLNTSSTKYAQGRGGDGPTIIPYKDAGAVRQMKTIERVLQEDAAIDPEGNAQALGLYQQVEAEKKHLKNPSLMMRSDEGKARLRQIADAADEVAPDPLTFLQYRNVEFPAPEQGSMVDVRLTDPRRDKLIRDFEEIAPAIGDRKTQMELKERQERTDEGAVSREQDINYWMDVLQFQGRRLAGRELRMQEQRANGVPEESLIEEAQDIQAGREYVRQQMLEQAKRDPRSFEDKMNQVQQVVADALPQSAVEAATKRFFASGADTYRRALAGATRLASFGEGYDAADKVSDWAADISKNRDSQISKKNKGTLIDDIAAGAGTMVALIGASGAGTAGLAPVVATSLATEYEGYVRQAMDSGLDQTTAEAAGLPYALLAAGIETLNPQTFLANKAGMTALRAKFIDLVKNGTDPKSAMKMAIEVAEPAIKESAEELSQNLTELGTNYSVNMLTGAQLNDELPTMKEVGRTVLVSSLLGGMAQLPSTLGSRGTKQERTRLQAEAMQWAAANPKDVDEIVQMLPEVDRDPFKERLDALSKTYKGNELLEMDPVKAANVADIVERKNAVEEEIKSAPMDPVLEAAKGDPRKREAAKLTTDMIEALGIPANKAKAALASSGLEQMPEGTKAITNPDGSVTLEKKPEAGEKKKSKAVESVMTETATEETPAASTGVPEGGVPVSTEAAILSIDQQAASERRIDDMDAARVISEQLSRGKKLAYGTRGDGSVYAGHDIGERQQIKLDMTQEERREFRNAEDDLKFASTPEERTAANARIQAALIEPTKRRIAQINEGSTTATEAPRTEATTDTGAAPSLQVDITAPETPVTPKDYLAGRGSRLATQEGLRRIEAERQKLRDIIKKKYNDPAQRADDIAAAKERIAEVQSEAQQEVFNHRRASKGPMERAGGQVEQVERTRSGREGRTDTKPVVSSGASDVARRITNAEDRFVEFAMENGGLSRKEAFAALASYRKNKAIKIDPVGGEFSFTAGGFAERDVLRRAAGLNTEAADGEVIPQGPPDVPQDVQQDAPVEPVTTITEVERDNEKKPTQVVYKIPGWEDKQTVVRKGKGGWSAYIIEGERDLKIQPEGKEQPTPRLAIGDASERLNRHGREKVQALINSPAMGAAETAARKAAAVLERAKLKGDKLYALPLPPSVWNGALRAMQEVIVAGGKAADAVAAAIKHIQASDWWSKKATQPEKDEVLTYLQGRAPALEEAVAQEDVASLKDNIKQARAVGAQKERSKQKDARKDFVQKVRESLGELSGRLTPAQTKFITAAAAKANPASPQSVSRFERVAAKTIAKANYADDLSRAKKAQKRAKKIARQADVPINHREALSAIGKVDVGMLNDPAEFLGPVQDYLDQFGAIGKNYRPESSDAIIEAMAKLQEQTMAEYRNMLLEEFGMEAGDVDPQQLYEALESDDFDAFADNLDDAKKKEVADAIRNIADYSQMGLESYEGEDLSAAEHKTLETLQGIDLGLLSTDQLKEYIKVADNITLNDAFYGAGKMEAVAKAAAGLSAAEKAVSSTPLRKVWSGKLKEMYQQQFSSVSGMFRFMFGQGEGMAKFHDAIGMTDLILGKKKVDDAVSKAGEKMADFYTGLRKKYKDADTDTMRAAEGIAAYVLQPIPNIGLEESFGLRKQQVADSIAAKSQRTKRQDEAEVERRAFDLVLNDATTRDGLIAAMKSKAPSAWASIEFLSDEILKPHAKDVLEHRENFWNEAVDVDNPMYFPISYRFLTSAQIAEDMSGSFGANEKLRKPKESANLIKRETVKTLPKDRVIDMNIRRNALNTLERNLYDTYTSPAWQRMREFFRLPKSASIVGGLDNSDFMQARLNDLRAAQMREGPKPDELERMVSSVTNTARKAASQIALGGFTQAIKQPADQLTNAMVNVGPEWVGKSILEVNKAEPLLQLSAIGDRGELIGGTNWDNVLETETAALAQALKGNKVERFEAATERWRRFLMSALAKSDVLSARTAWLAYYQKYLADKGIQVDSWQQEADLVKQDDPVRRQALAYAEVNSDITQGSSDPTKQAKIGQRSPQAWANLLKAAFNPFSSFTIGMRERIINDASDLMFYGGKQMYDTDGNRTKEGDRAAAAGKSLLATLSSNIMFTVAKAYIAKALITLGADGIRAILESAIPDDDDERTKAAAMASFMMNILYTMRLMDADVYRMFQTAYRDEKKEAKMSEKKKEEAEANKQLRTAKSAYTSVMQGMITSGFTPFADNAMVDGINWSSYMLQGLAGELPVAKTTGKPLKYEYWVKQPQYPPLVRYGQGYADSDYGVFSVILDRGTELMDQATDATGFGQKEKTSGPTAAERLEAMRSGK